MFEPVTLVAQRVNELVQQYGSLRAAAKALACTAGHLSRIRSGKCTEVGNELLKRMGVRRVVHYERIHIRHVPGFEPGTYYLGVEDDCAPD